MTRAVSGRLMNNFLPVKKRFSAFAELLRGWFACIQAGKAVTFKIPRLGRRNIVTVERGGTLEIRGRLRTCRDVEIVVYEKGRLILEDNVYIGHGSTIACAEEISIGKNTMIADLVTIRDMNHRRLPGVPLDQSGVETSRISIGADCWIGSKVTVVAGARIGDGVTVGANAVVAGKFDERLVIGGIPARVVRDGG
jgi:acetyltransferase-like isoleucine patch superfamily enzyme